MQRVRSLSAASRYPKHSRVSSCEQFEDKHHGEDGIEATSAVLSVSLVEEAERAFAAAAKLVKKNDNEGAISEYTHAINVATAS